jgi:hypothetical protein
MIVRNERHFVDAGMRVTRDDIVKAAIRIGLTEEQASSLWRALGTTTEDQPGFHAAHVAYYLGALIVAGAMGWFVTMAFDRLAGGMLTLIALATPLSRCSPLATSGTGAICAFWEASAPQSPSA